MEISRVLKIYFIAIFGTLASADPFLTVNLEKVDVTNFPNDIVKDFKGEITQKSPQNLLTLSAEFLKEVPPDTVLVFRIAMNNVPLPDYTIIFCDAFKDPILAKSVVDAGTPKNKFPKKCPVRPGKYMIKEYDPYLKNVPPGLIIDGPISATIIVNTGDGTNLVEIKASGTASHLSSLPIALPKIG